MSNNQTPTPQGSSVNWPPNGHAVNMKSDSNLNNKVENMIKFNAPKNQSSIIKVIGVGGGGSNAVNHMFKQGIKDVDFIICNTDAQALETSPVPNKIQLGMSLTEGRGAGAIPEMGKNAAIENIEEIKKALSQNTKMLFITAGMGGGTGTGAAPVIASVSRELGILTVGIVTIPFSFEGRKRKLQAEEGIRELRKYVDSLLIICNDKLRELYGNLELSKAFGEADNVLTIAAKGIAEIITVPGYVNVDFEDVKTVMKDSGVAIMGQGMAEGEDRAMKAIEQALSSPLLNDNNIKGASDMLLYISSGHKEVLMDEISEITEYIQQAAGATAEVIWGNGYDASLGEKISITLITTGFESNNGIDYTPKSREIPKPKVVVLDNTFTDEKKEAIAPKQEVKTPLAPIQDELDFKLKKPEEDVLTVKEDAPSALKDERHIIEKTEDDFILYTKVKPSESTSTTNKETEISKAFHKIQSEGFNKEDKQETANQDQSAQFIHPEAKAEAKQEIKAETKPEVKPEIKAEVKPEIKAETKVEDNPLIDKLSKKRQEHLKDLSIKLKDLNALAELERVPAYKRKEEELPVIPHSSESQVSKYSLSMDEDDNGKHKLKANNSFLHEKPD